MQYSLSFNFNVFSKIITINFPICMSEQNAKTIYKIIHCKIFKKVLFCDRSEDKLKRLGIEDGEV